MTVTHFIFQHSVVCNEFFNIRQCMHYYVVVIYEVGFDQTAQKSLLLLVMKAHRTGLLINIWTFELSRVWNNNGQLVLFLWGNGKDTVSKWKRYKNQILFIPHQWESLRNWFELVLRGFQNKGVSQNLFPFRTVTFISKHRIFGLWVWEQILKNGRLDHG